jgi:hypothetical protein
VNFYKRGGKMTELYDKLSMNGLFRVGLDGSANQIVDRQSSINWKKAASQGVDFMIWRMSIGGFYKDLSFIPNMVNAAEAGVTIRGAYVVVRPDYNFSTHMALVEEQLRGLEQIEGPQTPKPLIWLDVETYALKRKTASGAVEITREFTSKEINQRTIQLADAVKDLQGGIEPGFYSYGDFVISKMGTESQKAYLERFKDRFWLAYYYTPFSNALAKDKPYRRWVPRIFYDADQPMLGATIWQFGSEINQNRLGPEFGGEARHFNINRTHLTKEQLGALFNGGSEWPTIGDGEEGPPVIEIGENESEGGKEMVMTSQEYQNIVDLLNELKTGQMELKSMLQVLPDTPTSPPAQDTEVQLKGDGRPTMWVTVSEIKAPLREIYKYNKAGYPVWGIYGKRVVSKRVIAKQGKRILVYAKELRGDGGMRAYEIVSGQIIDGENITDDPKFFILSRHVSL